MKRSLIERTVVAVVAAAVLAAAPASAQGTDYTASRTHDGKPDLNGIWQALGATHWDIEAHAARHGPVVKMGALGAVPGGLGVVEGGKIPYLPDALELRNSNRENWLELDPAVKCYMPGIPGPTTCPFPSRSSRRRITSSSPTSSPAPAG